MQDGKLKLKKGRSAGQKVWSTMQYWTAVGPLKEAEEGGAPGADLPESLPGGEHPEESPLEGRAPKVKFAPHQDAVLRWAEQPIKNIMVKVIF